MLWGLVRSKISRSLDKLKLKHVEKSTYNPILGKLGTDNYMLVR